METVNSDLFGRDPKVQKAVMLAKNVSVGRVPVLIMGESGVGKRTLGRFIHEQSNRRSKPFLVVDCSGPPQEVENSILGYRDEETGSFHKGVLERGNKGTVVLANIECLGEKFQKRIHTILSELEDYDLDVRIIATSTKNLSKLVGSARFYRGLFTFISSSFMVLPPLRERMGDLEMLANYFSQNCKIESSVMSKLLNYYWIHNVRELKEVIETSLEGSEDGILKQIDLEKRRNKEIEIMNSDMGEGIRLMSLKEAEQLLIKQALIHTSENRTQAAKILGVSIRTLRNKINEYKSTGSSYFINLK